MCRGTTWNSYQDMILAPDMIRHPRHGMTGHWDPDTINLTSPTMINPMISTTIVQEHLVLTDHTHRATKNPWPGLTGLMTDQMISPWPGLTGLMTDHMISPWLDLTGLMTVPLVQGMILTRHPGTIFPRLWRLQNSIDMSRVPSSIKKRKSNIYLRR